MTATAEWLESEDMAEIAFVLLVDGLSLGFTTHPDREALETAWATALGDPEFSLGGGLKIEGRINRSIKLFQARISPSSLTFSVLDYDDVLLPLLFGESRTDIGKTRLRGSCSAGESEISVEDAASIPGLPRLYCGLETMVPSAEDVVNNTWTVARGQYAIFRRALGDQMGRSHEVSWDGDAHPDVTDVPTTWVNRQVGLYVCHRVHGVWSAGLPGTVENDAHLHWAGRLKKWSESGDGWIELDCVEITERLETTIGARFYEGTLAEGAYIGAGQEEFQIQVTASNFLGNTIITYDKYVTTFSFVNTRVPHETLAEALNALFSDAFVLNSGTYGPVGMFAHVYREGGPGDFTGYTLRANVLTATDAIDFQIRVSMNRQLWFLLGFVTGVHDNRAAMTVQGTITDVTPEREGTYTWAARADGPPRKFVVGVLSGAATDADLVVSPTNDIPFVPQGYIPAGFAADTVGFLAIRTSGGDRYIGVRQFTADTFGITGEWLGAQKAGVTTDDFKVFLDAPDDGQPIEVRQVWIEPYTSASGAGGIGSAMLRLILSTGTLDYNHMIYDTLPLGMGAGFPGSLVDVDSFLNMAGGDIPYLLVILKPEPLIKILESALNLTGAQLVWIDGQLVVIRPVESTTGSGSGSDGGGGELVYLTESNKAKQIKPGEILATVTERTRVERNPEAIINRSTLRYQWLSNGTWDRTEIVNAMDSQSRHEQTKNVNVDAYGIYDDESGKSAAVNAWKTHVASAQLAYFSRPVALARRSYDFSLVTKLYPGAKTSADDDGMVNPATGTRGIDGLLGWAVETDWDWATGVGQIAYAFQPDAVTTSTVPRLAVFAPSARVDETYDAGSGPEVPAAGYSDFTYSFPGHLTHGSAAAAATPSAASITLPENTLIIAEVANYHSTAASLAAAPTLTGTGGETWVPIDDVDSGGGAPTRRISRFRTMVAAEVASIVTMTFSGAQTNVGWSIDWYGSVDTSGSDGAGAVGTTDTANSTGVAQTSLPVPLSSDDTRNGVILAVLSGVNAAVTPRPSWTEIADFTISSTSPNRLEVQFRNTSDTDASASGTSSVWAGIATEIVSNNGGYRTVHTYYPGALPSLTFNRSIDVKAGRQYIFQVERNGLATLTPSCAGFTFTSDYTHTTATGYRFGYWRMSIPSTDATISVLFTSSAGGGYVALAVHEVWNFDTSVGSGTGIVQMDTETETGTVSGQVHTFTLGSAPTSRNNGMLMLMGNSDALYPAHPGWRRGYSRANDGSILAMTADWRGNADSAPKVYISGASVSSGGIVYEFAFNARTFVSAGTAGYDSATQTLYFRPHEYTLDTQGVDVSFFEDGDPVRIVDLSPTDPDAPDEWITSIDGAPDTTANSVVLADDLTGWTGLSRYVMEWVDISTAVADKPNQLTRGAFIADEVLRSTGNAANDAYVWGGDPSGGPADVRLEQDQPYRRLNNSADDMGSPLSTHKLHEIRDFLNTALAWTTRPVFVSEIFAQPATVAPGSWDSAALLPPLWIPLIAGATRSLQISALVAMETATDDGAILRCMTSTSTPSDDVDFLDPAYVDGNQYADIDVPETTTYAWYTVTLDVPAVRSGPVRGCYVTFDCVLLAPGSSAQMNLLGIKVEEAPPA